MKNLIALHILIYFDRRALSMASRSPLIIGPQDFTLGVIDGKFSVVVGRICSTNAYKIQINTVALTNGMRYLNLLQILI